MKEEEEKNNLLSLHPAPPPLDQQDGTKFSCLTEGEKTIFAKVRPFLFFPRKQKIVGEESEGLLQIRFLKERRVLLQLAPENPRCGEENKKSVLIQTGEREVCAVVPLSPPLPLPQWWRWRRRQ